MYYGFSVLGKTKWRAKRWYHTLLKKIKGSTPIDWSKWVQNTYILHLEDRADRYHILNKELKTIKTTRGTLADEVTWFPALSNLISWPESLHIDQYSFEFHWVIDPDPWFFGYVDELNEEPIFCSEAETAISIGHLKMWQKFLESDAEVAMFLEDDVMFDPHFEKKITQIFERELPTDWDMLYLGAMPNQYGFTYDDHSENLIRLYNGVWWMSSYVLTRKAAQYLVDNLPIVGPVDVWINYQFEDLKVFMAKVNLIEQAFATQSDNTYSFVEEFY